MNDYMIEYYRKLQESLPLWSDEYAEIEQKIREYTWEIQNEDE